MNEHNHTKVVLALIVLVGVVAIIVGSVVGAAGEHDPERDCVGGYCSTDR